MGVDYTAKTILGIEVDENEIYEEKIVFACYDNRSLSKICPQNKDVKFCNECGKPPKTTVSVAKFSVLEDEDEKYFDLNGIGIHHDDEYEMYFIGKVIGHSDRFVSSFSMSEFEKSIKEVEEYIKENFSFLSEKEIKIHTYLLVH